MKNLFLLNVVLCLLIPFNNSFSRSFSLNYLKRDLPQGPGEMAVISVHQDDARVFTQLFGKQLVQEQEVQGKINVMKVDKRLLTRLSWYFHQEKSSCGGFWWEENLDTAKEHLFNDHWNRKESFAPLVQYDINNTPARSIQQALSMVKEINVRQTIASLSQFKNRYYRTEDGVNAANAIGKMWSQLLARRSDAQVNLFKHKNWPQPSVVATIKGKTRNTIIIGGHLDSINQSAMFWPKRMRAPGADDNASGIATITEVIRVLVDKNYKPKHTISFMGYAAEEVGLRGSAEIAQYYKRNNVPVIGVMQLDMTNFSKDNDPTIGLTGDFTDKDQNKFLGQLIDRYVKVPWEYMFCNRPCSDHASWNRQGFKVSYPFEARSMQYMNKALHTTRDTLARSNNHAKRSAIFSKIALSFVLGLDAQVSF
jgi:leucyl aminopeptidase